MGSLKCRTLAIDWVNGERIDYRWSSLRTITVCKNHRLLPRGGKNMSQHACRKTMTAMAVIGLLTLWGVTTQAAAQGRSDAALAHAKDVQAKYTQALMAQPGITGTGVGYTAAGEPAIKVYVRTGADAAGIPDALDSI